MAGPCNGSDEKMHRQVDWLRAADVRILEYLYAAKDTRGNPSIQTPTTIAANTGHASKYVGERVRHLANHDLVERVERGKYRLSDRGERLMGGDLRPEDLEE